MKKFMSIFLLVVLFISLSSCTSEVSNYEVSDSSYANSNSDENPDSEESTILETDTFLESSLQALPILPDQSILDQKHVVSPKPSDDTAIAQEDTTSTQEEDQEHETQVPQYEILNPLDDETEIDVSSETLEGIASDFFSAPDNALLQEKLYQKLKQMYLSSEWDGIPFTVGEHTFSISTKGYILADNILIGDNAEPLDLPNQSKYNNGIAVIDDCNIQYIPGKGSYILIDENYMLYLRGERIPIEGSPLNWKELDGVDVDYGHARLHYVGFYDKMFLTTPMKGNSADSSEDSSEDYVHPYLYIFPDYNVSKIDLVAQIKAFMYNNEEVLYEDLDGNLWKYYQNNDGSYYFEMIK